MAQNTSELQFEESNLGAKTAIWLEQDLTHSDWYPSHVQSEGFWFGPCREGLRLDRKPVISLRSEVWEHYLSCVMAENTSELQFDESNLG